MAFLCPSRKSRQKKKKKEEKEPYLGRITGSASIDTLERVGLEKQHGLTPESRMTVLDDFTACAADELDVTRGQTVYVLYTEQEWMYVLMDDGKEGFIPRSFAKPCRSPALRKRTPPTPLSQMKGILPPAVGGTDDEGNDGDQSNSPTNSSSQVAVFPEATMAEEDHNHDHDQDPLHSSAPASDCEVQQGSNAFELEGEGNSDLNLPDVLPFEKREQGKWVAMFAYDVDQENDVKVTSGEVVELLNSDDKDWYWIRRSGGAEGFVPRILLCKVPDDLRISDKKRTGFNLNPPVKKPVVQGHIRSKSMTDHPVSLPTYPKPPPPQHPPQFSDHKPSHLSNHPLQHAPQASDLKPPYAFSYPPKHPYQFSNHSVQHPSQPSKDRSSQSSNHPVGQPSQPSSHPGLSVEPYAGSYNVPRAAVYSAVRQRPHSSMGCPITPSSAGPYQPSVPQNADKSVERLPLTNKAVERPHSSVGHLMKSLSHSHTSLPQAVSSEQVSMATPAQRPHSSMDHPITSSMDHPITSSMDHPITSSMDHPTTSSMNQVHTPFAAAAVQSHSYSQTSNQRTHVSDSYSVTSPNHTQAAVSSSAVPDFQVPISSPVGHVPFSNSTKVPSWRHYPSAAPFDQTSPSATVITAERAKSPSRQPPSLPTHSSVFTSALPPKGPQSSPTHSSPHSSPVDHPSSLPLLRQHHSPPGNHIPPSNFTVNRFTSGQSRHTNTSRLSSSLNQSQDGRRGPLMHQLSAPEFLSQQSPSLVSVSQTVQGRRSSHEPHETRGKFSLKSSTSPPPSRPKLGETGRSKSSTQFTLSQIPSNVTELMTLHKFSSRGVDDISVSSEEVVYSNMDKQPERGWLWVYSPRLQRHGYIPRNNVRALDNGGDLRTESVTRV